MRARRHVHGAEVGDDRGLRVLTPIARMGKDKARELVVGKDANILGEHAEGEPDHQLDHLVPPRLGRPVRVGLDQRIVMTKQLAARLDVDRVRLDRTIAFLAGGGQEEAEVLVYDGVRRGHEIHIFAGAEKSDQLGLDNCGRRSSAGCSDLGSKAFFAAFHGNF